VYKGIIPLNISPFNLFNYSADCSVVDSVVIADSVFLFLTGFSAVSFSAAAFAAAPSF
jgi:hypothetical protein